MTDVLINSLDAPQAPKAPLNIYGYHTVKLQGLIKSTPDGGTTLWILTPDDEIIRELELITVPPTELLVQIAETLRTAFGGSQAKISEVILTEAGNLGLVWANHHCPDHLCRILSNFVYPDVLVTWNRQATAPLSKEN